MYRGFNAALGVLLLLPAVLFAQGRFMEDFQDGNADGWKAGGQGTAQLSVYAGNYSMRLTKNAYALIMLPVTGSSVARVSAAFAASNLERKDACIVDVSTDTGKNWTEIFRIEDGADDDTCWGDNVEVVVNAKQQADLIIHNGPVFTGEDRSEIFEAVIIRDDRIAALGGEELVDRFTAETHTSGS